LLPAVTAPDERRGIRAMAAPAVTVELTNWRREIGFFMR
jgi:hypothetical protein